MARYAYLATNLRCPSCGASIADMVWFQWGLCPGYGPRQEYVYHVNDPIHWKRCKDGSIPAWSYFDTSHLQAADAGVEPGNVGDPAVTNIIVLDIAQIWLKGPHPPCGQEIEGAALEIRDGIIKRAWLHVPGELVPGDLDNRAEYFVIEEDGELRPMLDWYDHPMGTIVDC